MTTYELISEYRSGWNAFWWNTIAYFNEISLKTPYAPEEVEEDKLIETILQMFCTIIDLSKAGTNVTINFRNYVRHSQVLQLRHAHPPSFWGPYKHH